MEVRETYVKGQEGQDRGQVQSASNGGDDASEEVQVRVTDRPACSAGFMSACGCSDEASCLCMACLLAPAAMRRSQGCSAPGRRRRAGRTPRGRR